MKDIGKANIFEFNHIDNSLSESDVTTLKISINIMTRNTGVLRNLIRGIKFLMKHLLCLEEDWW